MFGRRGGEQLGLRAGAVAGGALTQAQAPVEKTVQTLFADLT